LQGFFGFITVFEFKFGFSEILFDLSYQPPPPCSIAADDEEGVMTLQSCEVFANNVLACTHLDGVLGDEEVGCDIVGECPSFNVCELGGGQTFDC
jgi:hypothetical protein